MTNSQISSYNNIKRILYSKNNLTSFLLLVNYPSAPVPSSIGTQLFFAVTHFIISFDRFH